MMTGQMIVGGCVGFAVQPTLLLGFAKTMVLERWLHTNKHNGCVVSFFSFFFLFFFDWTGLFVLGVCKGNTLSFCFLFKPTNF